MARAIAVADGGLEVVLALIGGVDGAKARVERQAHQRLGALFLPRGAVGYLRARSHTTSRSPNLPPVSAALTLSARSSGTMR